MKQKGKKLIALFLACAMLACEIPQQVFAARQKEGNRTSLEYDETAGHQAAQQENGFYYEREFSEEGITVSLSAKAGVIPENATIQISLLKDQQAQKEQIRKEMQGMIDQGLMRSESGVQSVFDMYYDLRAETEHVVACDFEITYVDKSGNICVFEPEEKDAVTVSMEIIGLNAANMDEMHSVELFYLPDSNTDDSMEQKMQPENPEFLTDHAVIEQNTITFDAEHFSVYTVAIMKYAAYASQQMINAEKKAWNLINNHADPNYFLNDPLKPEMTKSQYAKLHEEAVKATKGCTTQYDKIKAITWLVANEIYYDYKYYDGKYKYGNDKVTTFFNSWEVWENKRAVCGGYSNLMRTFLTSIGIPCMYIVGDNHAYNAAYDSTNKKWIFADATWSSSNQFTYEGEWIKGNVSSDRFDLSIEEIAALTNHEIYFLEGLLAKSTDSVYYRMETDHNLDGEYNDMIWSDGNWHLQLSGVKKAAADIKVSAGFEGLEVRYVCPKIFYKDQKLKTIDFSKTKVETIQGDAFAKCSGLASIKFSPSLKTIGKDAFWDCPTLKAIDLSKTKVETIQEDAFGKCSGLTNIKLPSSLKKIDKYAFRECAKLKTIDLTKTKIQEIANQVFFQCKGLTSIKFPQCLEKIHVAVFAECDKLKSIDLSKTKVTKIGESAFRDCHGLNSVKLPRTVIMIEDNAFRECTNLSKTNFPAFLKKIGREAFLECEKLKSADLSKTRVTTIHTSTWNHCSSLTNVKLPKTVTEIEDWAFAECAKLKTINLGKVKKVGYASFYFCSGLKTAKLSSAAKLSESSFMRCGKLEFVDLSKAKLTKIPTQAFCTCPSLTLIKLPSTIKSIGTNAFASGTQTPIKTIVATPLSAKKIGYTKAKASKIWAGREVSVCKYAYTIKFDKNGAKKGAMPQITCAGGIKTKLPANKFKRANYKFVGWNTKKNGKGTAVANQGTVKKLAHKDGAVVTLYAQWKKVK